MKVLVYGNGESRPRTSIGGDIISWGCNAIYRDFRVDNLVSIDYNIQQEIYESEYALTNKCWFSDWSVLPFFDTSIIKSISVRDNNPVYETKQFDRNSCVVQGATIDSVQRVLSEILTFNPQLDKDDLRKKLEKDIGLYITWVAEEDMVEDIDYPKGWSAGNTALYLACQSGAEEVYMLGFDGSNYSEPLNNIYKGSKNYLATDSRGFNTTNWDNQFKLVQKEFPNVKFYKVGTELTYEELYNSIR
jgi:hypothetical protein